MRMVRTDAPMLANDPYVKLLATEPLRETVPMLIYPRYRLNTPDLYVWRFDPGLIPGAIKVVFVETEQDRQDIERALSRPLNVDAPIVHFRPGIDDPQSRPSTQAHSRREMGVILYPPSDPAWPHIVVLAMDRITPESDGLARGAYGWDQFPSEDKALDHMAKLGSASSLRGATIQFRSGEKRS